MWQHRCTRVPCGDNFRRKSRPTPQSVSKSSSGSESCGVNVGAPVFRQDPPPAARTDKQVRERVVVRVCKKCRPAPRFLRPRQGDAVTPQRRGTDPRDERTGSEPTGKARSRRPAATPRGRAPRPKPEATPRGRFQRKSPMAQPKGDALKAKPIDSTKEQRISWSIKHHFCGFGWVGIAPL